MSLLSKQLELVENFENKTEMASGLYQEECTTFMTSIAALAKEEGVLVEEWSKYMDEMKAK